MPLKHFMTTACSCHYHVRILFVEALFVRSRIGIKKPKLVHCNGFNPLEIQ